MKFKIRFSNYSEKEMSFRLEPWGEEKKLQPKESLIVNAKGPVNTDLLEISYEEGVMTAYGWEGSVCEIETDTSTGTILGL